MTGRGRGNCAGAAATGRGTGFGRAFGFGGGGRGWRNMFRSTGLPGWMRFGGLAAEPSQEAQRDYLEARSETLKAELGEIRQRLERMSPNKADA